MSGTRKAIVREQDMVLVAKLALEGLTTREIATELDVSQATVVELIAQVKARWQTVSVEYWHAWVMTELAKLQQVEDEAWEAWHASKKAVQVVDQEGNSGWVDVPGDPRYLDAITRVMENRAKRLKLYDFDPRTNRDSDTEAARTVLTLKPGSYADTATAIAAAINGEAYEPRATSPNEQRRTTRGSTDTDKHQYPAASNLPRALRAV